MKVILFLTFVSLIFGFLEKQRALETRWKIVSGFWDTLNKTINFANFVSVSQGLFELLQRVSNTL